MTERRRAVEVGSKEGVNNAEPVGLDKRGDAGDLWIFRGLPSPSLRLNSILEVRVSMEGRGLASWKRRNGKGRDEGVIDAARCHFGRRGRMVTPTRQETGYPPTERSDQPEV